MENINEEKIKKFKKITELILNGLKERGINPILSEDDTSPNEEWGNSMTMSFSFSNGGLKYWYLGIWGCGRWSETYDCDNSEDYISVFLIHKWMYDKFRPSSSDIEYRITLNDKPVEIYHVIQGLEEIHKNPIQEYYKTFWEHKSDHDMPCLEYFRDWWFHEVTYPIQEKLRYKWSVKILYNFLKVLSWIDPRVSRRKLFKEEGCIPIYTSGFLATEWASSRDWAFNSFAWLYEKFPWWLCKICKHKLFDAHWNVADFPEEVTNTLEKRMWKGVVI